tara:strand:- start:585 stop:749 length:165 start_codon:yes stop_codon:yes gene_type:complete
MKVGKKSKRITLLKSHVSAQGLPRLRMRWFGANHLQTGSHELRSFGSWKYCGAE